jgi:hypothetical protein
LETIIRPDSISNVCIIIPDIQIKCEGTLLPTKVEKKKNEKINTNNICYHQMSGFDFGRHIPPFASICTAKSIPNRPKSDQRGPRVWTLGNPLVQLVRLGLMRTVSLQCMFKIMGRAFPKITNTITQRTKEQNAPPGALLHRQRL